MTVVAVPPLVTAVVEVVVVDVTCAVTVLGVEVKVAVVYDVSVLYEA